MTISKRVKNSLNNASWVRRMFEEGEQLKRIHGEENVYDFSLGNPNLEPPASLKKALKALADNPIPGMHRYMPNSGYSDTRKIIAEYLKEESGLPFDEKHVVMTVGAAGGLNVVLKSILDEGEQVIVPSPYFMEFKFYIENSGGEIRLVETNGDFSLNLSEIEKAIGAKTKAILINSPFTSSHRRARWMKTYMARAAIIPAMAKGVQTQLGSYLSHKSCVTWAGVCPSLSAKAAKAWERSGSSCTFSTSDI